VIAGTDRAMHALFDRESQASQGPMEIFPELIR